MATTVLSNLVNPEVMADMISAQLPKRIKFSKIARIDTTLSGQAGNTITVPKYGYIGDAADVAENTAIPTTALSTTTTTATVKKAGKAVEITDEAVLSGYGDPMGEAQAQLTKSVAAKVDNDCYDVLKGATATYAGGKAISYAEIVKANAVFGDEIDEGLAKVMFIHPDQEAALRLDPDFIDKSKSGSDVMMSGVIGKIAGVEIVKSKKVEYDTVGGTYLCPIVIVDVQDANEDANADKFAEETPAITVYLKRNVQVEADRDILKKTTVVSIDEHYVAVLSNDSKVVLAKFTK